MERILSVRDGESEVTLTIFLFFLGCLVYHICFSGNSKHLAHSLRLQHLSVIVFSNLTRVRREREIQLFCSYPGSDFTPWGPNHKSTTQQPDRALPWEQLSMQETICELANGRLENSNLSDHHGWLSCCCGYRLGVGATERSESGRRPRSVRTTNSELTMWSICALFGRPPWGAYSQEKAPSIEHLLATKDLKRNINPPRVGSAEKKIQRVDAKWMLVVIACISNPPRLKIFLQSRT